MLFIFSKSSIWKPLTDFSLRFEPPLNHLIVGTGFPVIEHSSLTSDGHELWRVKILACDFFLIYLNSNSMLHEVCTERREGNGNCV